MTDNSRIKDRLASIDAAISDGRLSIRPVTAVIGPAGVTLSSGGWSEVFPLERLPAKLAFYRDMAKRYGHPSYHAFVAALAAPTQAAEQEHSDHTDDHT